MNPEAWEAHIEKARACMSTGNLTEAEKIAQLLAEKIPSEPLVHLLKGDIYASRNQFPKAEKAYHKAILKNHTFFPAIVRLASCYMASGKAKEAMEYILIAEKKAVQTPEDLVLMHQFWKLSGDLEKAEQYLLRALDFEPEDIMLQETLARFYFETGQSQNADVLFHIILKKRPHNRQIKKYIVETWLLGESSGDIYTLLQEMENEAPGDPDIEILKGKYYLNRQDFVQAATHLKNAADRLPGVPAIRYLLSIAYLADGRPHLALIHLKKALAMAPLYSNAELLIAEILYNSKQNDIALKHVSRVLEHEPGNFRAHMIRGNILISLGRYEEAERSLTQAAIIHPDSEGPPYFMALTAELSGNTQHAIDKYQELHKHFSQYTSPVYRKTKLLVKKGLHEKALESLKRMEKETPENPALIHLTGEIERSLNNNRAAESLMLRAIELSPETPNYRICLAKLYEACGKKEKQIVTLKNCSQKFPQFEDAYQELSRIHLKDGNVEKAINILEGALTNMPESPGISANLAWAYLTSGEELDKALILAGQAHEKIPNDPAILDTLGWAYYKKGMYSRAAWFFKDSLQFVSNNPLVRFHLGLTMNALGKTPEAITQLKEAIRYKLPAPMNDKAMTLIRQLESPYEKRQPPSDSQEYDLLEETEKWNYSNPSAAINYK